MGMLGARRLMFSLCIAWISWTFTDCQNDWVENCVYFKSPLELTATLQPQKISIPNVGRKYAPNQHCEWQIETENSDHVVKLEVVACNIEGPNFADECVNDMIDVYDITEYSVPKHEHRICGSEIPLGTTYLSSHNRMTIVFVSNLRWEFSGFTLEYSAQTNTEGNKVTEEDLPWIFLGTGFLLITLIVLFCVKIKMKRCKDNRRHHRRNNSSPSSSLSIHPNNNSNSTTTQNHFINQQNFRHGDGPSNSTTNTTNNSTSNNVDNNDYNPSTSARSNTPPPSYESVLHQIEHDIMSNTNTNNVDPRYGSQPHELLPDYETVLKEDSNNRMALTNMAGDSQL